MGCELEVAECIEEAMFPTCFRNFQSAPTGFPRAVHPRSTGDTRGSGPASGSGSGMVSRKGNTFLVEPQITNTTKHSCPSVSLGMAPRTPPRSSQTTNSRVVQVPHVKQLRVCTEPVYSSCPLHISATLLMIPNAVQMLCYTVIFREQ